MSKSVVCKSVSVTKLDVLIQAATALGCTVLEGTRHKLWEGSYEGVAIRIPGWTYPVVFNLDTGNLVFDNHNGHWGDEIKLDALVQRYVYEDAIAQAYINGETVETVTDEMGNITLAIGN